MTTILLALLACAPMPDTAEVFAVPGECVSAPVEVADCATPHVDLADGLACVAEDSPAPLAVLCMADGGDVLVWVETE